MRYLLCLDGGHSGSRPWLLSWPDLSSTNLGKPGLTTVLLGPTSQDGGAGGGRQKGAQTRSADLPG